MPHDSQSDSFQVSSVMQINHKSINFSYAANVFMVLRQYHFPLKQGFSALALLSFGARQLLCSLSCADWDTQ